jgi:hypothetical protein
VTVLFAAHVFAFIGDTPSILGYCGKSITEFARKFNKQLAGEAAILLLNESPADRVAREKADESTADLKAKKRADKATAQKKKAERAKLDAEELIRLRDDAKIAAKSSAASDADRAAVSSQAPPEPGMNYARTPYTNSNPLPTSEVRTIRVGDGAEDFTSDQECIDKVVATLAHHTRKFSADESAAFYLAMRRAIPRCFVDAPPPETPSPVKPFVGRRHAAKRRKEALSEKTHTPEKFAEEYAAGVAAEVAEKSPVAATTARDFLEPAAL